MLNSTLYFTRPPFPWALELYSEDMSRAPLLSQRLQGGPWPCLLAAPSVPEADVLLGIEFY